MSLALGFRTCAHLGCHRAAMTTANGRVVYAYCDAHTALAQTNAFGPQPGAASPLPGGLRLPADRPSAIPAVSTSR